MVALIVRWVAEAEGMLHTLTATESHYTALLFGPHPVVRGMFAERGEQLLGGALWTLVPGTFSGRPGLFVEDVAVAPEQRGQGMGRALFASLARRARAEGCDRMEWRVRDDNMAARRFYDTLRAAPQRGTTYMRLDGAPLDALAA